MGITIIMYQDTELKFDSYNFNTTHPHIIHWLDILNRITGV